jgi:hypothetical protein
LEIRLFHGLTPETDTSCFYFWSAANGFLQDEPAATEQLFAQVAAASVFLRCPRDQTRLLDPAASADPEHRAQLERGAH